MLDQNNLREVIEKLINDTASDEELQRVQRLVLDGKIIIAEDFTDYSADRGAVEVANVITFVSETKVRLEVGAHTHDTLRDKIFAPNVGLLPPLPPLTFLGRAEDLLRVKGMLGISGTGVGSSQSVIEGWPGVGKTTLVGALSRDPDVASALPDGILWTSLNQKPDVLSTIATWGRALGTEELQKAGTIREATAGLKNLLGEKRMLLIVDDVWVADHAVPFFEARGSRSSLLITTRLPEVASALNSLGAESYKLPVLKQEDSIELLRALAPGSVIQHPEECRELVDALGYLPLALQVAGRLLKAEERMGWGVIDLLSELRERIINEKAPANMSENGVTPTVAALLRKSTDTLEEQTRDCFAMLGAFPEKPATFDLEGMAAVWEIDAPREMARRLVGRGLLEPDGTGRFQMHALLVMHARSLCEDYDPSFAV